MKRLAIALCLLPLVIGLVGCDHATKRYAEHSLSDGRSKPLVADVLELRLAKNRGFAFSAERWFPNAPQGSTVAAIRLAVLALFLGVWWFHRRERWPVHLAFALTVSGALGNLIDGLRRGYVVDFVHLGGWPIFNLADVYIAAGALLLLAAAYTSSRRQTA
ncbi:MAG: signal peptidase II [bacterium]